METGDQAREFFMDLCYGMRERAWNKQDEFAERDPAGSPMKRMYNDRWSFMHGVTSGIHAMKEDRGGREWEQQMEEFGYGAYGRGMRVGRRLAFYEPGQFDFTMPEDDEDEYEFTFSEPEESESQFTFSE